MPTAYARFGPEQRRGVSASYSRGWGMQPGVAILTAGPEFAAGEVEGPLRFFYDGAVFLELPGCRLIQPSIAGGAAQTPVMQYEIHDRTWRWQFGTRAYGDFNKERPDGVILRPRSPRELVFELWLLLGEQNVDVTALPAEPRPRTVWDATDPLQEIERLCAEYGCAPLYDPISDKAKVVKIGVGEPPPEAPHVNRSDVRIEKASPARIRAIGGVALFQRPLALGDGLAREPQGFYVPANDAGYAPGNPLASNAAGYASRYSDPIKFTDVAGQFTDPQSGDVRYNRELAKESVFRAYEIAKPRAAVTAGGGTLGFSQFPEEVFPAMAGDVAQYGGILLGVTQNDPTFSLQIGPIAGNLQTVAAADAPPEFPLWTLGPFLGTLLEKQFDGSRRPMYGMGIFADERIAYQNTKVDAWTHFPGSVSIDGERGVATFSAPLFRYGTAATAPGIVTPFFVVEFVHDFYVVAAFSVSRNGIPLRYERWRDYSAGSTEHFTVDDNAVYESVGVRPIRLGRAPTTNAAKVDAELNYFIAGSEPRFAPADASVIEYGGFRRLSLDGKLRSVGWSCSTTAPPRTTASWNTEPSDMIPPYENRPTAKFERRVEANSRRLDTGRVVATWHHRREE